MRRWISTTTEALKRRTIVRLVKPATVSLSQTKLPEEGEGKTRIWMAEILEDGTGLITWGVEGGKLQTTTRTVAEGKQGRDAENQLILTINAIAKQKVDRSGYVHTMTPETPVKSPEPAEEEAKPKARKKKKTPDTTSTEATTPTNTEIGPVLPMLATSWNAPLNERFLEHFNFSRVKDGTVPEGATVHLQPKLDGIRCVADVATGALWSRSRQRILGLDHISQQVLSHSSDLRHRGVRFLDGEIYKHGMGFQSIVSIARRIKEPHADSEDVSYVVFDGICESPELSFAQRWEGILPVLEGSAWTSNSSCVTTAPTELVSTPEAFVPERDLTRLVDDGYEGLMVRVSVPGAKSSVYRQGIRSPHLIKIKTFEQEEFPLIGTVRHKERDTLGAVVLGLPDGRRFRAAPAEDEVMKFARWQERSKYENGKWICTVKYQHLSDEGIPRFPVCVGFRYVDDVAGPDEAKRAAAESE